MKDVVIFDLQISDQEGDRVYFYPSEETAMALASHHVTANGEGDDAGLESIEVGCMVIRLSGTPGQPLELMNLVAGLFNGDGEHRHSPAFISEDQVRRWSQKGGWSDA
jgi:hypothetical protein